MDVVLNFPQPHHILFRKIGIERIGQSSGQQIFPEKIHQVCMRPGSGRGHGKMLFSHGFDCALGKRKPMPDLCDVIIIVCFR